MAPQLKERDKVYLSTKNLRIKRPKTKKLDHAEVGPFWVQKQTWPVNYQLELPPDAKIDLVFHVLLLQSADLETPLQITFRYEAYEEQEFEVEKLLK